MQAGVAGSMSQNGGLLRLRALGPLEELPPREDDVAVEIGGLSAAAGAQKTVLAVAGNRVGRSGRARGGVPGVAPAVAVGRLPDEVGIEDRFHGGPVRHRQRIAGG